jgi:hypothetical protein
MKKMKLKSLFAAALLLTPVLAFGAPKNSAKLTLDQPVNVAGTQLTPGEYKLIWEGDGSNVTVSFVEGKKVVATASAQLVSSRNDREAIETRNAGDNTTILQAVDFNKVTLQFEDARTSTGN